VYSNDESHFPAMQSTFVAEKPPPAVALLRHSKLSLVQHCAAIALPSTLVAVGSVTQTPGGTALFAMLKWPSITQTPLEGKTIGATGDGDEGGGAADVLVFVPIHTRMCKIHLTDFSVTMKWEWVGSVCI